MKSSIIFLILCALNLLFYFEYGALALVVFIAIQFVYAFMIGACKVSGDYYDQSR